MFMLPSQFANRYFCKGSAPSQTTLRKWIDDGLLPGRKVGSKYYVDIAKFQSGGDELLERILSNAPAT